MIFIIIILQRMSKLQEILQSDSYQKYMDVLLQLNTDYAEKLKASKDLSNSEKKVIIKAIGAQNFKESKNVRRRLRKLKELDGRLDSTGSAVVQEIKSIISNSQIDIQEKKTRIRNIIDQFSDLIDMHYELLEQQRQSNRDVQIESRAVPIPVAGNNSDVSFINKVQRGRMIRGVFLGINVEEYQTFLARDVTPRLIDVDTQSIDYVGIYTPDKATTRITTRQFETREQKQFSRRDAELGTVNFSADFSASWFVSVSVAASAQFSKQKNSQNSGTSEMKYYCKQQSHQIVKKQVIFDKYNLKLNVHFKNKIKQLEGLFNSAASQSEKMTLNRRIWKEVFEDYGTHFYTGAYVIGGRYDYLIETNYSKSSEKASVVEEVSRKLKIQVSVRAKIFDASVSVQAKDKNVNVNTSALTSSKYDLREETLFKGGSGTDLKDFIKGMENKESWCVLGQTKMQESYIPIWTLIKLNYPSISSAFVAEIQHAYYSLIRNKLETYVKSLHSKIINQYYGSFNNQRIIATNGTGFGAIYTKNELFVGNLLNRRAHGLGVKYPYKRDFGQLGIWKRGVLVEGIRIFPNSKYNYEVLDQKHFDNLTYSFMMTPEAWEVFSKSQSYYANYDKDSQGWIFQSKKSRFMGEGFQDQNIQTSKTYVSNQNEQGSYNYYHDHLIAIYDKASYIVHLENVPSGKVAIGVISASEIGQEKISQKASCYYHNFNKNVYDGSSSIEAVGNAQNGQTIIFKVDRVKNKLSWWKGELLIAQAKISDYLKEKSLSIFVKLENPNEAVNIAVFE